jgi:hypothetical protein
MKHHQGQDTAQEHLDLVLLEVLKAHQRLCSENCI